MARYNITLPDEVVAAADKKAKEMGLSRSAFIASAIQFKIQYDQLVCLLPSMLELVNDIRSGNIPSVGNGALVPDTPHGADDGGRA